MAKRKRGRRAYDAAHVRLYQWLLRSAAWRSLTPAAKAVYLEVEARHNGSNNGLIALSVRDAAKLCNIAKDTAGRAFKELQEKGFLVLTTPGSFSRKVRHATEWRLTAQFHEKEGTTKEFMRWKPQERLSKRLWRVDLPGQHDGLHQAELEIDDGRQ